MPSDHPPTSASAGTSTALGAAVPTSAPAAPVAISVDGLSKTYRRSSGDTVLAVDDLSLEVTPGELVAVVGPSGCGKTTLLRCIAGLERPSAGDVSINGRLVYSGTERVFVPPESRGIGMMFQTYALWPHMSVAENVAYPLRSQGVRRKEIRPRVDAVLKTVGLDGLQNEQPGRLSGGQQQRVALARSLVAAPSVILFDEPLSSIDAKIREELRLELVRMHKHLGFTGLYVTHDQDEALQICSRLVVLRDGRIEQQGRPAEVYRNPASAYVATFVGASNELRGTVSGRRHEDGQDLVVVDTALGAVAAVVDDHTADSETVTVLVRRLRRRPKQFQDGAPRWRWNVNTVNIKRGERPWVPTPGARLIEVYDRCTMPITGVFEVAENLYLSTASSARTRTSTCGPTPGWGTLVAVCWRQRRAMPLTPRLTKHCGIVTSRGPSPMTTASPSRVSWPTQGEAGAS